MYLFERKFCSDILPGSGIAGSYGSSIFSFTSILFSIVVVQFTFSPTVQEGSLFSTPSPAFVVCGLVNDGHSDWGEVVPHCSFDF